MSLPDDETACRGCGGSGLVGDGVRCATCQGAWVAELSLLDLVADATFAPLGRLPWEDRGGPAARACETCGLAMRPVALYGIALDRCDGHGVWLDGDELERVLREAPRWQAPFVPPPMNDRLSDEKRAAVADVLLGDSTSFDESRRDGLLGALFKLFG